MSLPRRGSRRILALLGALLLFASVQGIALGDGTEVLGPAQGITIADGSGIVAAGVGMVRQNAGTIDVTVPAGASVEQVLLYWEGHNLSNSFDDTIAVDGISVTGDKIGGTTLFFTTGTGEEAWSTTLRADITGLGLVTAGANSLEITGMDFDRRDNGAGVLVIYDDGSDAEIGLFDGNDLAFIDFAPPLDSTEPVTFSFASEPVDRTAMLTVFASSVRFNDPRGVRPSVIEVSTGGTTTEFLNELAGGDGDEWDTVILDVAIPANANSLTVQMFSEDRSGLGGTPASFAWNVAALSVPITPPDGGEGCTPGYWKQAHHFDSWVGYAPDASFSATFGVPYDKTLLGALKQGGGQEKALGRHAVAALLNASSSVDFLYSEAEVIALVQDAWATGDYEGAKDLLASQNELGCPLN